MFKHLAISLFDHSYNIVDRAFQFSMKSGFELSKGKAPSTLMRFRMKTHTFFYPFSPSVDTNTIENGGVCLRKRRFSKTLPRVEVFENGSSEY